MTEVIDFKSSTLLPFGGRSNAKKVFFLYFFFVSPLLKCINYLKNPFFLKQLGTKDFNELSPLK